SLNGESSLPEEDLNAISLKNPLIKIDLSKPEDLGAEFFRWEIATAVACSIIGVDAFDQPDVQAAKDHAKSMLKELEAKGSLPSVQAHVEAPDFKATFSPEIKKRFSQA